jgi:hypothetical protein
MVVCRTKNRDECSTLVAVLQQWAICDRLRISPDQAGDFCAQARQLYVAGRIGRRHRDRRCAARRAGRASHHVDRDAPRLSDGDQLWGIIGDSVVPSKVGSVSGFVHFLPNCSGIVGPAVTGFLVQGSGNFESAFFLTGAISLTGALGLLIFVRPTAGNRRGARAEASLARNVFLRGS